GADFSGAPNFAYDFCVQNIIDEDRDRLDLTRWRVAFNGAEPVRRETLVRFYRRFANVGFSSHSFYPCYGLAEATLFVSGGVCEEEPRWLSVSAADLERNRVRPCSGDELARVFVSCGRTWGDQEIVLVDPERGCQLPDGHVGEVWIAGRSVAGGYFE